MTIKELFSFCSEKLDFSDSPEFEATCIFEDILNIPKSKIFFDDTKVTDEQINALDMFLKKSELITKSKENVIKFCLKKVNEDKTNQKKDNIFSYIKPEAIFVKRDEKNPRVALMCKYKYDLEHGLAIVFDYKGNIKVGLQDIIL